MTGKMRNTGIDILGNVPWGTHFCLFYQTKEDLIDILVPFFKAGLENNEFCLWITSEPLNEKEAQKAMRKAVPNLDRYLKRGQIEIDPHAKWYLKNGVLNLQKVLNAWIDKLNQALSKGYDGIRVTGNTAWLEKRDWRNFTDYEEEVNKVIGKYQMIAICSYSLTKCRASEIIDVASNHQFALIRRKGKWELIESSERRLAYEKLKKAKASVEKKVKEATRRLRKQHQAQQNFFIDLAHELKTPLTIMKGNLGLALGKAKEKTRRSPKNFSNFLTAQKEEVERIEKIINDLSILAKAETNQLTLRFRKIRLDKLIEKLCLRLQTVAKKEKKKLSVKKLMPLSVVADQERLEELISNLLGNALKFTKPGSGQIQISLTKNRSKALTQRLQSDPDVRRESCRPDGTVGVAQPRVKPPPASVLGEALIRIKDNGIGIPKKELPYLFKRLYRGTNTKNRRKLKGSGLGLAICQWIVKEHGGKIMVKSRKGIGTEFLVLLPRLPKS